MGGGRIKKKVKHISQFLGSRRVQTQTQPLPASAQPSTPSKRDRRGWTLSKQSGSNVPQSASGEHHPSFLSRLVSALSPGRSPTNANLPGLDAPATNIFPTDSIPTPQHPIGAYSGPTQSIPLDDDSSIASDLGEEGEPDDQDGVHGNYHHVSCIRPPYVTMLMPCSLPHDHTSSFSWVTPSSRVICWMNAKHPHSRLDAPNAR